MPVKQLKRGLDNFCYIIYCDESKKAAVVDPGFEITQTLQFLKKNNLHTEYIIFTHYHGDHTGDIEILQKVLPAQLVASEKDGDSIGAPMDRYISHDDQLNVGKVVLKFLVAPGHTPGGLLIIVDDTYLLTGDTLFIGDCGRTDLPGGNINEMFATLHDTILSLPDHLVVYPGHDYGDLSSDTLGNQKRTNKTLLAKTLKEFMKIP